MAGAIVNYGGVITCKAKTSTTNTEEVWRTRAATKGYMVVHDQATGDADYTGVDFIDAATDVTVVGLLIGTSGSGTHFKVSVRTAATRIPILGATTGALAAGDYFSRLKGNTNGKMEVDNTQTTGNVFVVGGTKAAPEVRFRGAPS